MISFLLLAFMSQARAAHLTIPFGTSVMDCGTPDARETLKDGPVTCVNAYKKSIPNAKFSLKNGKIEGKVFGYEEDGSPKYEGLFHNGMPDGEVKESYLKSKKMFGRISHYRAGKKEGVDTDTNDQGYETVTLYKDDKRYGPRYQLKDGKIIGIDDCDLGEARAPMEKCDGIKIPGFEAQLAQYKAAQDAETVAKEKADNSEVIRKNRAGVIIERYTLRGGRRFGKHEINFADGKLHFVSDEEGSVRKSEIEYFDGGQVKRKSTFDPKQGATLGTELTHEDYYQNGKLKLTWTRLDQGPRISVIEYKEYFDNGRLQSQGKRKGAGFFEERDPMNLPLDGIVKNYDEKGDLVRTDTFKDGKRDGLTRAIALDDQKKPVILEMLYANDTLQKTTTIDQKTKKVLRLQEFMPDGSAKSDASF